MSAAVTQQHRVLLENIADNPRTLNDVRQAIRALLAAAGTDAGEAPFVAWDTSGIPNGEMIDTRENDGKVRNMRAGSTAFNLALRDLGPKMAVRRSADASEIRSPAKLTDAMVREAMQTAWDDFCDDAQAIPGDISRRCGKTYFTAGVWADHTAMHLRNALAPVKIEQTLHFSRFDPPGLWESEPRSSADDAGKVNS